MTQLQYLFDLCCIVSEHLQEMYNFADHIAEIRLPARKRNPKTAHDVYLQIITNHRELCQAKNSGESGWRNQL
jgi:hypothetical protein